MSPPKLVEYEEDLLMEAAGYDIPGIIPGAAYNECSTYLRRSGLLDGYGNCTEAGKKLGDEIYARRFPGAAS